MMNHIPQIVVLNKVNKQSIIKQLLPTRLRQSLPLR